jgi:hypothetical protein
MVMVKVPGGWSGIVASSPEREDFVKFDYL